MTDAPESRQIAVVRTWQELHAALRARSDELGWKRTALDELAGAASTPGYFAKLLAPIPIRNLGPQSFGAVITTLGLMLIVVEDVEMVERMRRRAAVHGFDLTRDPQMAKNGALRSNLLRTKDVGGNPLLLNPATASEFNRLMINRRWAKATPAARRKAARHAARAKWAKWRREKKRRAKTRR